MRSLFVIKILEGWIAQDNARVSQCGREAVATFKHIIRLDLPPVRIWKVSQGQRQFADLHSKWIFLKANQMLRQVAVAISWRGTPKERPQPAHRGHEEYGTSAAQLHDSLVTITLYIERHAIHYILRDGPWRPVNTELLLLYWELGADIVIQATDIYLWP